MLNRGLEMTVIDANSQRRNMETGRGGENGLIMIETYTQMENALGLHLRYLQIM